jgi:hypothetical protein
VRLETVGAAFRGLLVPHDRCPGFGDRGDEFPPGPGVPDHFLHRAGRTGIVHLNSFDIDVCAPRAGIPSHFTGDDRPAPGTSSHRLERCSIAGDPATVHHAGIPRPTWPTEDIVPSVASPSRAGVLITREPRRV